MKNTDDMTPRARTYAIKKFGVRIDCMVPFNDDYDYWFAEFSDGTMIHVRTMDTYKPWDGKAGCEREAREIATLEKLNELLAADSKNGEQS